MPFVLHPADLMQVSDNVMKSFLSLYKMMLRKVPCCITWTAHQILPGWVCATRTLQSVKSQIGILLSTCSIDCWVYYPFLKCQSLSLKRRPICHFIFLFTVFVPTLTTKSKVYWLHFVSRQTFVLSTDRPAQVPRLILSLVAGLPITFLLHQHILITASEAVSLTGISYLAVSLSFLCSGQSKAFWWIWRLKKTF